MILVVGAGVAGLSAAIAAEAAGAEVHLISATALQPQAGSLAPCNTALAQGGIAAAIGDTDSTESHTHDTISAGVGLVDHEAAQMLTAAGADRVRALIRQGFAVDRCVDGTPALGLEAAHSQPRIVHAGEDRTGAALYEMLTAQVRGLVAAGRIHLTEHHTLTDLVTRDGAVTGAVLQDAQGMMRVFDASAVVLATGGYAALWSRTSNHAGARGEGIVSAARAGALLSDLEFVQFHPTVLGDTGFLISEAVRGAGAVLRDGSGTRFMTELHPAAELAPRDVVSRETHRVLRQRGDTMVWLDATGIERDGGPGTLSRRFPKITAAVTTLGYDWAREAIPVAPAAHYTMGGVATDLDGRTTVLGLFAAGEIAATGVHGANRLASNSLLEGLVFGERAGRAAATLSVQGDPWILRGDALPALHRSHELRDVRFTTEESQRSLAGAHPAERPGHTDPRLTQGVDHALGIERNASDLSVVIAHNDPMQSDQALLTTLIAEAALARTESRGAHQRADYPHTDPTQAQRRGWRIHLPSTSPLELRSFAAC